MNFLGFNNNFNPKKKKKHVQLKQENVKYSRNIQTPPIPTPNHIGICNLLVALQQLGPKLGEWI
jgi:hypothetical protein